MLIARTLPYWRFADRFGWTMSQVDAESWLKMRALLFIDDVAAEVRAEASARQRDTIIIQSDTG